MDRVTEATKDCFNAIIQLRQVENDDLPAPETLHVRLRGFVDEMLRRCHDLGFQHNDAQDMAYAVVALLDETALSKSEAVRGHWMGNLLQFHYFQENLAGEGFFNKLGAMRNDPRRVDVLKVFYLCLLFGFQGRFRIRGGELELMNLTESLQQELNRKRKHDPDALSPSGARPMDGLAQGKRGPPLFALAAGVLAFAVVVYGGLKLSLSSSVSGVAEEISAWKQK
jgi:type VI secretion system protein ImpK